MSVGRRCSFIRWMLLTFSLGVAPTVGVSRADLLRFRFPLPAVLDADDRPRPPAASARVAQHVFQDPVEAKPADSWPSRRLTLVPGLPPSPPLKYPLLMPSGVQVRGNAALEYLRATALLPLPPRDPQEARQQEDKIERWLSLPLEQLAPEGDAIQTYLEPYQPILSALHQARHYATCDWQLEPFLDQGHKHLSIIMDNAARYRELTRLLRLQFRMQLARGQTDQAWQTVQAHLHLGRDIAESPTMIRGLVGLSILASAWDSVEEWLSRPDAPNQYLSLNQLPHPWPRPEPMLEGEARFMGLDRPEWQELTREVLPPETARRHLLTMYSVLYRDQPLPPAVWEAQLLQQAARQAPAVRAELLQLGQDPKVLEPMSEAQLLVLRNYLVSRQWWDILRHAYRLPYHQAHKQLTTLSEQVRQRGQRQDDPLLSTYALTIPAAVKTHHALARLQRRIAALQTLEAIRWHAAIHQGQLPERLTDVTIAPLPVDPYTGQPFLYSRTADGFALEGPAPAGEKPDSTNTVKYIVLWNKTPGAKPKK